MRHSPFAAFLLVAALAALCGSQVGWAGGAQTRPLPGRASLLAGTGSSVVVATIRPGAQCTGVTLWAGARLVSAPPLAGCEDGPSGGAGVGAVATSGSRAVWTAYACGNTCDWLLRTATTTRPAPRTLRLASRQAGAPSPIVVGRGSALGVPYAVNGADGAELVLLGDDGAARLRGRLDGTVAGLAAGPGPGGSVVAVARGDGTAVTLRPDGTAVSTIAFAPGAVRALALAPLGIVVQVGREVRLQAGAAVRLRTTLPAGGRLLSYALKRVLYAVGTSVRLRSLVTGADTLVRTGTTVASLSPTTLAWATGSQVSRTPAPR